MQCSLLYFLPHDCVIPGNLRFLHLKGFYCRPTIAFFPKAFLEVHIVISYSAHFLPENVAFFFEVTIHTLPHLKCIRSISVRSNLPCINIGVRIEMTLFSSELILYLWAEKAHVRGVDRRKVRVNLG